MKILTALKRQYTAIEHYRQVLPHEELKRIGVDVTFVNSPLYDLSEVDKFDYDIYQFSRNITYTDCTDLVNKIHKSGGKIVFDIDDYWRLPDYHPMSKGYKDGDLSRKTEEAIKIADLVTVSTEYLYHKAKELNPNVHIVPNSIPSRLAVKRDLGGSRIRFGYAAGVYHLKDAAVLEGAVKMLFKNENYDNFQMVLAGFNVTTNGSALEYLTLERYMTGDYAFKRTERDYIEWLSMCTNQQEHVSYHKPYKRVWSMPVTEYLDSLNNWDVSLAPLYNDVFTKGKSELKAIEAGMMGKALICSPVQAYSKLTHRKNCLKALTDKDWYISFKQLINNENLLKDLQENLSEFINENYNFEKVQKQRLEIYKTL